ncbi:hypothetical protein L3X38_017794 [Prunus dulcis]|uniref:Uncharacterized protein n=1 Tax=Prunus dulcis TaxID=3755 RepID=A0AAD4W7Z3_PRUDU|nr:hypothetical protein L3X38_017794 [Prunus dulcis]
MWAGQSQQVPLPRYQKKERKVFRPWRYENWCDPAIGLRMSRGGEAKTDLEVGAKLFEFCIVKLPAVVCDDGIGDAEATNNILPDKCFDAGCSDGG